MNRWIGVTVILALAGAARGEPAACPEPRVFQAALEPPIRSGVVRVVETGSPRVYACWVRSGRQAYESGRLEDAVRAYETALRVRTGGVGALLGLAAVAMARHQPHQAQGYYSRVLRVDPRNPYALAGLALLAEDRREEVVALLQQLLRHRDDAALYFLLGNLHARAGDWSAAQRAYFEAFRRSPERPDYAFNLAVSLERLGKARLAARYYEKALQLAQVRHAGFDPAAARRRLRRLTEAAS